MTKKINQIKSIVAKELSCSAHDMDHIMRVYNLCLLLAKAQKIDREVLEASALLHDIARTREDQDKTGQTDHAILGAEMAKPILEKLKFSPAKIEHIQSCIISHRSKTNAKPETLEAKILFDADKLDVIGAIGIARALTWIGRHNAKIYKKVNINEYIRENMTARKNGRIKDNSRHSPQIEYELKNKYLLDKLHTKQAKKIGKNRLKYFKNFLDRLEAEVEGKM